MKRSGTVRNRSTLVQPNHPARPSSSISWGLAMMQIDPGLAIAVCVAAYHYRRERGPGAVSLIDLMRRTDRAPEHVMHGVRHAEVSEWLRALEGQWLLTAAG